MERLTTLFKKRSLPRGSMEWKLHPVYGYPYENVNKIMEMARKIDMTRLGADHTTKHPIIDDLKLYYNDDEGDENRVKNNYDQLKRVLIALALLDNLSMTEGGLLVRWIMPRYDLADGWGRQIKNNEWWVPCNGDMFEPDESSGVWGNQQIIYQTNASVARNDRKCMVMFGFGFGQGASRTITTIKIKYSDVNTRTIVSMDVIPEGKAMAMEWPVFWKRNDDCVLWGTYPGSNWKGKRDNIVVYGFVVEALGVQAL